MSDVLIITLGGLFGVVLGKALNYAPAWVFYVILSIFMLLAIYTFKGGAVE